MNKFEKIALQCAKQDKRNFPELKCTTKRLKRSYVVGWKKEKWSFKTIKDFRVWNRLGIKI